MNLNVFEGARRISLLMEIVWVIGCAVMFWTQSPHVSLTYQADRPSALFQVADNCGSDDAREYKTVGLADNKAVHVTLCFKAHFFENRGMLVPYREEEKRWWGGERYSSEVRKYTEQRAAQFSLAEGDKHAAADLWATERRSQFWNALGAAVGGCIALMIATFSVGWIVRGFFGIPSGKDFRPETNSKADVA